jgi:exo-beta-1,3-glucanase (GH17 family)
MRKFTERVLILALLLLGISNSFASASFSFTTGRLHLPALYLPEQPQLSTVALTLSNTGTFRLDVNELAEIPHTQRFISKFEADNTSLLLPQMLLTVGDKHAQQYRVEMRQIPNLKSTQLEVTQLSILEEYPFENAHDLPLPLYSVDTSSLTIPAINIPDAGLQSLIFILQDNDPPHLILERVGALVASNLQIAAYSKDSVQLHIPKVVVFNEDGTTSQFRADLVSERHKNPMEFVISNIELLNQEKLYECPLLGLAFSPYMDGQDPNHRIQIAEDQIRMRLSLIKDATKKIRTFGNTLGLENTARIAREFGLQTSIGAWLDKDTRTNSEEIQNLIMAANNGEVDVAVVGNETLFRGDLTVQALIGYIQQVRENIPKHIPVTTSEVMDQWLVNPALIEASDVIYANSYPFWEGRAIEHAIFYLNDTYLKLRSLSGSKSIVISETGWPTGGESIHGAIPSSKNSARYLSEFVTWAEASNVEYFYFEAFDEKWKSAYEGELGANWGIFDNHGVLKSAMNQTLNCSRTANTWSASVSLDNGFPDNRSISFISVPPKGSFDNLVGTASNIVPADYAIVVYIQVNGRWWVKPTFAQPKTPIRPDGGWETNITTGGIDEQANRIQAFLIPANYDPPALGGARSFPQELLDTAVVTIEAVR